MVGAVFAASDFVQSVGASRFEVFVAIAAGDYQHVALVGVVIWCIVVLVGSFD